MSVAFDTLSYARRMEGVGFTRAQAEAMAEEQAKLIDERLATKTDIAAIQADIEALRLSTKADTEALRLSTKADIELVRRDIELLRRDMIIRLGGIVIASVAAGSTIVTLLSRLPTPHPSGAPCASPDAVDAVGGPPLYTAA
jgi:hypothetical protein